MYFRIIYKRYFKNYTFLYDPNIKCVKIKFKTHNYIFIRETINKNNVILIYNYGFPVIFFLLS